MISSFYDTHFKNLIDRDVPSLAAAESTATTYLDGKPALRGKHKITRAERHTAFWSSNFLTDLPTQAWKTESMMLALAQYMGQERVSNTTMLASVAAFAPGVLIRAVRCSGLVLTQHSPRRTELDQLATTSPAIAELCEVLDIFDVAHRQRTSAVFKWQSKLADF